MIYHAKQLYGKKLGATDGDIGHVKDLYFDDVHWGVRYVVADTGSWLSGRQVLLSPRAFGTLEQDDAALVINLTRKQIENSPSIETHRPVSRQYEAEYYHYYGWPVYWVGDGFGGMGGFSGTIPVPAPDADRHHGHNQRDDVHLRSTRAVAGYHIQTASGLVGRVHDFAIDDQTWLISEVIVETGHWFAGREILISPQSISRISYEQSTVLVNLTREDIQRTAEDSVAKAGMESR
jgi:uncharacterized protein YrrD